MSGGTYALLVHLKDALSREVGSLGACTLQAGHYVYVGSASGPGGFARIDRHREVASGERDVRHWHIDYLLPASEIVEVYRWEGADIECAVAEGLPGDNVDSFGASDCECSSHLMMGKRSTLESALDEVSVDQ